MIISK